MAPELGSPQGVTGTRTCAVGVNTARPVEPGAWSRTGMGVYPFGNTRVEADGSIARCLSSKVYNALSELIATHRKAKGINGPMRGRGGSCEDGRRTPSPATMCLALKHRCQESDHCEDPGHQQNKEDDAGYDLAENSPRRRLVIRPLITFSTRWPEHGYLSFWF